MKILCTGGPDAGGDHRTIPTIIRDLKLKWLEPVIVSDVDYTTVDFGWTQFMLKQISLVDGPVIISGDAEVMTNLAKALGKIGRTHPVILLGIVRWDEKIAHDLGMLSYILDSARLIASDEDTVITVIDGKIMSYGS